MNFALIDRLNLTPKLFEEHPVWVEYYEPEDINRMVLDGFNRHLVESELKKVGYSDDYIFPLVNYQNKSPHEFTLYKANVEINRNNYSAYLFVTEGCVSSFSIYVKDEWYPININYFDKSDNKELSSILGGGSIFPIRVTSNYGVRYDETFNSLPISS